MSLPLSQLTDIYTDLKFGMEVKCKDIVACQAHPALVKIGLVLACLFHFKSLLVCIRLVKVLRAPCVDAPH